MFYQSLKVTAECLLVRLTHKGNGCPIPGEKIFATGPMVNFYYEAALGLLQVQQGTQMFGKINFVRIALRITGRSGHTPNVEGIYPVTG